jgi:hypothetical protein
MTEPKYTSDFQDFWYDYPARVSDAGMFVKVGKFDAFVQWKKLPDAIKQKCLMLVKNKMIKCGKFTQDACRFLSHRRWEDYPDYVPTKKPTPVQTLPRYTEPVQIGECLTIEQKQAIAKEKGWKR